LTPAVSISQTWGWLSTGGGSLSDKATDMDIDADGNLYVCGYYNSTGTANDVSFGPLVLPANGFGKEGYLAKMDPNGNWVWIQIAEGGWDERVLGMCVDKINGYAYVCGTAWNYTDFGSCTGAAFPGGSDEIFVSKFDLNGNCQWLIGAGGGTDDHGYDLVTDSLGNIYLTGYISDKYQLGNVVANFGTINIPIAFADSLGYIAKISPAGIFQWVRTFHGVEGERDNRIAIDKQSNVYVTGGFRGTNTSLGNVNATSYGGYDIYVIKFDNNGNQQWVRTTGSTLDDRGNSITIDMYGDVYVTGEFRDKVGFDGDTINNNGGPNGRDIFVAKMKTNGNWVWAKKAGSNGGSERGNRIISNNQGNIFVTGQFKGNANFGSSIQLNSVDSVQLFTAAIDTSGKWKWALQGGSAVEDRGTGLAVDSCNLYTCGYYEETATFGSGQLVSKGRKDALVVRTTNACFEYVPPVTTEPDGGCVVKLPNVFSPNRDNKNETFAVTDSCVLELTLTLYNRWGNKIYTLAKPTDTWNGMIAGKEASEGVYYYAGQATLSDNRIVAIKGFITLVR
ncbi:MAG: gliding motility-associated C-terminal domain-containing protein, partial [Flavobacteriales bacterium]